MDETSNLGLWFMVIVISAVGVLTKMVFFEIGKGGREAMLEHVPRLEPERLQSLEERYTRSGSRLLLLSSIPGIGSAIAASAGLFRTPLLTFILLVLISNLIRNGLLIFIFGGGVKLLTGGN